MKEEKGTGVGTREKERRRRKCWKGRVWRRVGRIWWGWERIKGGK